jgi:hypothetical protein
MHLEQSHPAHSISLCTLLFYSFCLFLFFIRRRQQLMSVDLKSDGLAWDEVDSFSLDSVWADDVGRFQLRFIIYYTFLPFFLSRLVVWRHPTPRQGIHTIT